MIQSPIEIKTIIWIRGRSSNAYACHYIRDFLGEVSFLKVFLFSFSLHCWQPPRRWSKCPKWRIQPQLFEWHRHQNCPFLVFCLPTVLSLSPFLISAPTSNLANSLRPIFAWFYLNQLHLASLSWLFNRLKLALAIRPALRVVSFRVGTHPPEPLSPHLDDPAPRWRILDSSHFFLICLIPATLTTPVIIPTTRWLAGLHLSFAFAFASQASILRSGQILWIRGLTRLQTQVGAARGSLLCTPECISSFCKSWQHFTLDNLVCQLRWMTRILQTIFCIKQCLEW